MCPSPDRDDNKSLGDKIADGLKQFHTALTVVTEGTVSVPRGTPLESVAELSKLGIGIEQVRLGGGKNSGDFDIYPAVFNVRTVLVSGIPEAAPEWLLHTRFETSDGIRLSRRRKSDLGG